MGSQTFDFLTESFLFRDDFINDNFRTISEQEILQELDKYREFCLSKKSEIEEEVIKNTSNLNMLSGMEMPDLSLLKQSAFYVNQYIINDPIFSLGYRENEFTTAFKSSLGIIEEPLDRSTLSQVVSYVKQLTPMVSADYVKFLPINSFLEPPEQLPLLYSENLFSDILPQPLLDFFYNNTNIKSVERLPNYPQALRLNELQLCREIMISFNNHTDSGYFYVLYEPDFELLDQESGKFEAHMILPDEPPDIDFFRNWVTQSFNSSCKQIYDELFLKNVIASNYRASYLAESQFVFDLLSQFFPTKNNIPINTANIVLNMKLPFLENVDIAKIMEIRMNYGEEFQNFRVHLEKQFKDLRLVKDPQELKIKVENALHELTEVQIHAITQKMRQMRKTSLFVDGLILSGSLLAAIQTGEWSIAGLSAVLATVARGVKPFIDYENQIKQNPAFFLWKVKNH
ncbi:hypothetical protein A0J48_021990 [Sphaerospermopsis aphanizomenoides BCCUSP55]|uniref:hypothetical protein n=1 Tax=Sphaerospermopsis aphanizomenoides TaxID=459663 RepID=UPI001903B8C3|nr:hypothetical protein [Sphaerospermopsis aphanizomenoides]MBK1990164.1 hypothetical protein [Sphaerospermopsis aphanizomenoides BCCUSP55]